MTKKITINQIAQLAQVAPSTVFKALNNQKGVNPILRKKIQTIAEEAGYKSKSQKNSAKIKRVFAVFPNPEKEDSTFYATIWKGMKKRAEELASSGFEMKEVFFNGTDQDQLLVLEDILENHCDNLDGLVTLIWDEMKFLDILEKFSTKGIPIFTITSDAPSSVRVASSRANAYKAGRLAAEYLGSIVSHTGSVIITGTIRNIHAHEQTVRGFLDQMVQTNPAIQVYEIYENKNNPQKLIDSINNFINKFPDICGIYANNARTTSTIGKLLQHSPKRDQIKIVGTEVFNESCEYVKDGIIDALIDENPFGQGYDGISIVYNSICKKENVNPIHYVHIGLVLQNNLPSV